MKSQTIPVIKRKPPLLLLLLMAIPFFLIAVPLNWLLWKLGKPAAFMRFFGKQSAKSKIFGKAFANYVPDSHDVFVCAFSKSGTNWMMQMAHQTAFRGQGEFENIHDVVTWPEMLARPGMKMTPFLNDKTVQKVSPTGLRVIKTHLSVRYVPYNDQAHYLVVVRDPKEVLVSSYPFIRNIAGPVMPAPDVWLELFLTREFPMNLGTTWAEHTAGYWALKDKSNVLVLSYKKMKADLAGTVNQVSAFLNVDLNEAELASVIERSSFDYMKAIDHKFYPVDNRMLGMNKDFSMIRSGKAGNASETFSLEQQMRIDDYCQHELKKLGSDFPYSDFCRSVR